MSERHHLVVGFGVTGAAVATALRARGEAVVAVDDRADAAALERARTVGVELVGPVTDAHLDELVRAAVDVLPGPGLPAHHPVFALAAEAGTPVRSEFDLAAEWDKRPLLAVTGTDGKTTVVTLVRAMLEASGLRALDVGNTATPLVAAIDDPTIDAFVVEASSFRLAHSQRFAPAVATWLNFAPDHLDNHPDLAAYERAKARIWADQSVHDLALGNAEDPVVARHLAVARARTLSFGLAAGDYTLRDGRLITPAGDEIARIDELHRALPHDLANALAAAGTALNGGATIAGVRTALVAFRGLPHRVTLVGEAGGVRFYDDSKATAPHATCAAVRSFDSVVLIAGGRNKGLDLTPLADVRAHVRAVVAIGEAAPEVAHAFAGVRPVHEAHSMDEAVAAAASLAQPGDAVVLSPGCASYDWYASYGERGDDFARAVRALVDGPHGTAGEAAG